MIIAVDFDGTLIPNGFWPGVSDDINETLFAFLIVARRQGDEVILWTNRTGEPLNAAIELCKKNGLEFDAVNDNVQKVKNDFDTYSRKITADVYIDDKVLKIEYKGGWATKWKTKMKKLSKKLKS